MNPVEIFALGFLSGIMLGMLIAVLWAALVHDDSDIEDQEDELTARYKAQNEYQERSTQWNTTKH